MSTYLLAIGINHYTDRAFRALSCCENDASEIHALFKRNLELGDRASKLVGAVSIADVKNELRRIGQEIRNGDTFVLFFAGHGYQHPKREDQFLLFPEAEARLVNKGYLDGMLSLSALCELTEHWAGVARVFILDACRSWLPGRDAWGARFDNEAALAYIASRDPAFGPDNAKPTDSLNAPGGALPPVILNATRNGQEAKELEDRQRGVLALALEQALESQHKSGEVIWLGEQMLTDVNQRMNTLLQHGRLGVEQTPFLTPPSARVLLFKPQRIAEAPTNDDDETEWAITCAKQSIEAYETYARRKPPGKYRDEALRRIGELTSNDASQEQQAKTKRDEARRQNAAEKLQKLHSANIVNFLISIVHIFISIAYTFALGHSVLDQEFINYHYSTFTAFCLSALSYSALNIYLLSVGMFKVSTKKIILTLFGLLGAVPFIAAAISTWEGTFVDFPLGLAFFAIGILAGLWYTSRRNRSHQLAQP